MGWAREVGHFCRASKSIPINAVCEDDAFREAQSFGPRAEAVKRVDNVKIDMSL
jgi:hypothetical protein